MVKNYTKWSKTIHNGQKRYIFSLGFSVNSSELCTNKLMTFSQSTIHKLINPRLLPAFDHKPVSSCNVNAMEKAISFLKRLHPVSGSLEAELRNTLRFTKKRKNEFLLFEGEVCHYAWYLQKGLVRCYYKRDEHEVTTWFGEEDHAHAPAQLWKNKAGCKAFMSE